MYSKQYTKIIFIFLILISIALRIFALFFVDSITHPETWEYEMAANNLLSGKGLSFTYLGTEYRNTTVVLYSLVTAIIYFFSKHSFLAVKIFQLMLSVFSCLLVYKISRTLFNKSIGIIALTLMTFHAGLIAYSAKLHPLTLDVVLFLLFMYFLMLIIVEKSMSIANSLLAGLCIGMALLTRATIALFIPVALLVIFLGADKLKRRLRSAAGILVGVFIVLSPLFIRNYFIFDKIVIMPTAGGVNFWTGNNINSLGTANTLDGKSMLEVAPEGLLKRIRGLDEFNQDRIFYEEGMKFIKSNPYRAVRLFAKKLYYFWWFTPTQGLNYPRLWFQIYKFYYSFAFAFFILGVFNGIKGISGAKRQMAYMLILFAVTISIAQALYYVDGRHRWTIEPFILIFSACGVSYTLEGLKFKRYI